MKLLLNNYLMQVDSFTVQGVCGNLPHEWVEVHTDAKRYYYDTTMGRKDVEDVPYDYIEHDKVVIREMENRTKSMTRTRIPKPRIVRN